MDLVERYIEAVKFWLPKNLREDIAAELREDIRSQIEEAEREKGRPLTEDEVGAILKARGTPLSVASRYLPQRALIGPTLFPLYIFALKMVAGICLIPAAVDVLARILDFNRPQFGPFGPSLLINLLVAFAIVTIVFAVIEWKSTNDAKTLEWNPKRLLLSSKYTTITRTGSIAGIVGSLVLLGFFALGYLTRTSYDFPGGHAIVGPEWGMFWQFMAVMAVVQIAFSALGLYRPYWTVPRILIRFAMDLAWLAAFVLLLQSPFVHEIAADWIRSDVALQMPSGIAEHAVDAGRGLAIAIAVVAIVRLIEVLRLRYRLSAATA